MVQRREGGQLEVGRHRMRLVAHRGWSKRFPENSLPSLAAGVAAGADEIEFDLRLSSDGIPFLCHDAEVNRVSNLEGPTSSFTIQELKQADLKMPDGTVLEHLGFSSVDEVFQTFGGLIAMNIHIKDGSETGNILAYITERYDLRKYPEIYIAGDAQMLQVALEDYAFIPRCCLADAAKDPELLVDNAIKYRCARLQFRRTNYTKESVARALEAGLTPNLFYADDLDGAQQARDYGIMALLTNDIGYLKKRL